MRPSALHAPRAAAGRVALLASLAVAQALAPPRPAVAVRSLGSSAAPRCPPVRCVLSDGPAPPMPTKSMAPLAVVEAQQRGQRVVFAVP